MHHVVNKENYCQIWTWPFNFISLYFVLTFAMKLKDANYKSHWNVLVFCEQWKMVSDLNISHETMSYFISFLMFGFTLFIKLRNFHFKSHWNTLIFFDKKDMVCALKMPHGKMSDFVSFPLFAFNLVINLKVIKIL